MNFPLVYVFFTEKLIKNFLFVSHLVHLNEHAISRGGGIVLRCNLREKIAKNYTISGTDFQIFLVMEKKS